jgi:hypothetical protein
LSETRRLLLDFELDEIARKARKDPKVKSTLVKALTDTSDIVRQRALIAAVELGDPTVVTDIAKALKDEDDEVRIAAAEALAYYQQPSTIPNLLEGLKDTNTWVRSHCASGLSKLIAGPIWARIKPEDVDTILADFPDMNEEEIQQFMIDLQVRQNQLDKFMKWRRSNYEVDIDTSVLEDLEGKPLILEGAEDAAAIKPTAKTGITPEVEEVLSELPDELRSTLPEEDLKRLTPATARELVKSLLDSFPAGKKEEAKKKKTVKVKKVKKVKKKKTHSREELLSQIPDEVKSQLPSDVLEGLSIEELEAVVSAGTDGLPASSATVKEEEEAETKPTTKKAEDVDENLLRELVDKYGEEKAEILISVPPEMLEGIPEDQIKEMDLDSLKDLANALEPR